MTRDDQDMDYRNRTDEQKARPARPRRAGLRADELDPRAASRDEPGREPDDIVAAGTAGGGLSAGGLGGTNVGNGSVEDVDLENAMGAGIYDEPVGDEDRDEEPNAYSGRSGSAVGGTPAGKREVGGRTSRGIAPGNETGLDGTIGQRPDAGS